MINLTNTDTRKIGTDEKNRATRSVMNLNTAKTLREQNEEMLKERGLRIKENNERLNTPVKVEFSLEQNIRSFDLLENTKKIIMLLIKEDTTIQIINSDQSLILYETGSELPEGEESREKFKVRELTFRKGNRKVILYFTMESNTPINRIKFTHPIKQYLQNNNI